MAKCRSMFVFVLVFTWTAVPALACLPNAAMTQAEMACCKKMAGDCHMGAGEHSCCKTKAERAIPTRNERFWNLKVLNSGSSKICSNVLRTNSFRSRDLGSR
jgi:hypothetical protein